MTKQPVEKKYEPDLDWIKLRADMDAVGRGFFDGETWSERVKRKMVENPLVPIGAFATCCALGYGLISFKRGNRQMSQYMMRARVVAQGFTILVAVGGLMIARGTDQSQVPEKLKNEAETSPEKPQEPKQLTNEEKKSEKTLQASEPPKEQKTVK